MKTGKQAGETLSLAAPYDVLSGGGFKVGSIIAIAVNDALSTAAVEGVTVGVFSVTRATGGSTAWTVGLKIYWDDSAKKFTKTSSSNTLAGVAVAAAGDSDTTGMLRLNGSF